MPDTLFYTGFESGNEDSIGSAGVINSTVFPDDGEARTGQFCAQCISLTAAAATGFLTFPVTTAGQAIANEFNAIGRLRVFFKLLALPSGANVNIAGYGVPLINNSGNLVMRANGDVAATASTTLGAYSALGLTVGNWYKAEVKLFIDDPAIGTPISITTVDIYNGTTGAFIGMVTASGTNTAPLNFPAPAIGHNDAVVSTYLVRFDDVISRVQDNGIASLPAATRVTRVDITGQIAGSVWTGDFRGLAYIPRETVLSIKLTGAATGQVNFTHDTSSNLGITGIEALTVYGHAYRTTAGVRILIGGTTFASDLAVAFAAKPNLIGQRWLPLLDADFDNLTWGFGNSGGTTRAGQIYAEVLHAGTNKCEELLVGTGSWKQKSGNYLGSGAFRTIAGIGFRPQVILIKKCSGVASAGALKLGCFGGSQSKPVAIAGFVPDAIMHLNDDGFTLGASTHVNEVSIAYEYIAFQDGGFELDCKVLRFGEYVGTTIDSRDIIVENAWQPDLVLVAAPTVLDYRTSLEVGDSSIPLSASATLTDLIQALNVNGFQAGATINIASTIYPYFAIKSRAELDNLFKYGTLVAAGAAHTVTGLLFAPLFVIAKRIAAVDAQWRGGSQLTTSSNEFGTVTANATGITAFTADGFSLGSSLAQAGQTSKWIAFKTVGELNPTSILTVDAGPDQAVNAFSVVTLAGSASSSFPCSVLALTYLWTKVSGPGAVVFSNDTILGPTVTFGSSGVYVLRLTVDDGSSTQSDDIQITINNAAPVVDAGPDQSIQLVTPALLAGIVTDDGLPIPPATVVTTWSKTSGPGIVSFGDPAIPITTATFALAGVYILRLTAFDGDLTTFDEVTISVSADCAPPIADPVICS